MSKPYSPTYNIATNQPIAIQPLNQLFNKRKFFSSQKPTPKSNLIKKLTKIQPNNTPKVIPDRCPTFLRNKIKLNRQPSHKNLNTHEIPTKPNSILINQPNTQLLNKLKIIIPPNSKMFKKKYKFKINKHKILKILKNLVNFFIKLKFINNNFPYPNKKNITLIIIHRKNQLIILKNMILKNIIQRQSIIKSNSQNRQKRLVKSQQVKDNKLWSLDQFQLIQKIGRGAFGQVFLARQKQLGFLCAIKKLSKKRLVEKNNENNTFRQIKIQLFCQHPNLVNLYGTFDDQENVYLIMEYLSDGTLMNYMKGRKIKTQKDAVRILKQICNGIKYLHHNQIIHRDIKPQNIFLHQGLWKIGDFGCSVSCQNTRTTRVGTLVYMSIQQLMQNQYDFKIDIWALGILAYQLLFQKNPFQNNILKVALKQQDAKLGQVNFPINKNISKSSIDFIKRCLCQNKDQRINIQEAMEHPFFLSNQQQI